MGIPVEIIETGIDWAAWVQAIGSIIAILVSVGLAVYVHHLSEKAHLRREGAAAAGRYAASRGAIVYVQRTLARIRQEITAANGDPKNFKTFFPKQWLLDATRVLTHYQNREHDYPDLVVGLYNADNHLDILMKTLSVHSGGSESFRQCEGWLKHAEDNIETVLGRLDTTDM